jgi:hypothetical protein
MLDSWLSGTLLKHPYLVFPHFDTTNFSQFSVSLSNHKRVSVSLLKQGVMKNLTRNSLDRVFSFHQNKSLIHLHHNYVQALVHISILCQSDNHSLFSFPFRPFLSTSLFPGIIKTQGITVCSKNCEKDSCWSMFYITQYLGSY